MKNSKKSGVLYLKLIKVQYVRQDPLTGKVLWKDKSFWVSEKNPYFEWYKRNYEVLKEVEK